MVKWKRVGKWAGAGATVATGGYLLSKTLGGGNKSSSSSSGSDGSSNNPTETGEDGTGDGTGTGSGTGSNLKTEVVEVPIDNYEEAMDFATREWNKIKRNNGRTLECQVLGSTEWMVGEWCKVYLPSFDIDGYMYITRVSQSSDGGEWTCNLSLQDYPPGWGKEVIENNEEENSSEDSTGDSTGDGTGDGTDEDSTGDGGSTDSESNGMVQVGEGSYHYDDFKTSSD